MGVIHLTTEAMQEGSYFIVVSFKDEDDAAVVPNAGTIYWTMTDESGTVVNDLDYESEASASSITIELEGDDLAMQSAEGNAALRYVVVMFEYDSDLGNDKPGMAECTFVVRRVKRIPTALPD
jgi:hypothetical protein